MNSPRAALCTMLLGSLAPAALAAPPPPAVESQVAVHLEPLIPPRYGQIVFGAFAGEAALVAGIEVFNTSGLSSPRVYRMYREAVRYAYGADLLDMNYFSVGMGFSPVRYRHFTQWLLMAGEFGDVTVALEPLGRPGMDVFRDNQEMRALREAFRAAEKAGIKVWVRFASESNLQGSLYTVATGLRASVDKYRRAVWFREFMPDNVRLVFSPLINTAVSTSSAQRSIVRWSFLGGDVRRADFPWHRIGGTIYRTDLPLRSTYNTYYEMMQRLAPGVEFQLCELGGPYGRRGEMLHFLDLAAQGEWPLLRKINLFAATINRRADPNGQFGFISPENRRIASERRRDSGQILLQRSFLFDLFQRQTERTAQAPASSESARS